MERSIQHRGQNKGYKIGKTTQILMFSYLKSSSIFKGMQKKLLLGLILVCGISINAVSAFAQSNKNDDYQQSISDISQKIKTISKSLNGDKTQLKTEHQRLFKAEKELAKITNNLANTEFELAKNEHELAAVALQIKSTEKSQIKNRKALRKLLLQRYKKGSPNYLKNVLNQENPYAVGRLANYHEYFTQALKQRNDTLTRFAIEAESLQRKQLAIVEQLKLSKTKQALQAKQQDKAKKKRQKTIANLDQKVSSKEQILSKLTKDRKRLKTLLAELKKQAAELRKIDAERQKKADELAKKQKKTKKTKTPSRVIVKGGFKKQKGRLGYPVKAKIERKYGSRLPESGMRSEGHFFKTKGSESVKSIFRGRVLFSDFLKGYGLLIIIDHGDNHISLYGHNDRLLKKVGDPVDINEVIAQSGMTGGLKSHGLYFEIRNNANPVDPAKWCR